MALKDLAPWHHGKSGAPATFGDLHREVDRVFENFWSGFGTPSLLGDNGAPTAGLEVKVDASEDDKAYHGKQFGYRDHTTVLYALNRISALKDERPDVRATLRTLKHYIGFHRDR
jgi:hypothetical protein